MSLPDINLAIQSLILIVFLVSVFSKIRGQFFVHGTLMFIAVFSAIASFLWFVSVEASTFTDYLMQFFDSTLTFTLFVVNTSLTFLAVLLGFWIVVSWRFRTNLFCALRKKVMRLIFVFWILGFIFGVLFYFTLNTNLIA